MKTLLPLFASAILLVGCAGNDTENPWDNDQERADEVVAQTAPEPTIQPSAPVAPLAADTYQFQKKAADIAAKAKPVEAPPLAEGRAVITAMRGDAGLLQLKMTEAPAAGAKLILTKEGKSLQVVVHSVEGEDIIADITPLQINTPTIAPGDEVSVVEPQSK